MKFTTLLQVLAATMVLALVGCNKESAEAPAEVPVVEAPVTVVAPGEEAAVTTVDGETAPVVEAPATVVAPAA
ncbi:MAG: hypothetical protein H0W44_01335 [Gammaproteobacteria bacterium]|nr:hypothetical protein [Gammaproteobacteria bacterium]